jgi:uncharacterized protein involved in exopolysaccharide biosynthesis
MLAQSESPGKLVKAPVGEESPEAVSPLQVYLTVLRNRWRIVLAVFAVTVASAVVFTSQQTPVYQAVATVMIDPEPPRVVNITEVVNDVGTSQDYYTTQYKLLQSRPIVEPVIQQLNLRQRMPEIGRAKDPYTALMSRLTIDPVKNTRLVLVKAEDPDPALAMEVANAIASRFVNYNLEIKRKEAQAASEWLNDQIQALRAKAVQSRQALQAFQSKADLLGVQDQRQLTQAKLIDFNRAYLEAQSQRLSAEAKLRQLQQIAKDPVGAESVFAVVNDPVIQKLKTAASDLQIERSRLAQLYRDKHPDIQQVDAQLREVKRRLTEEIQKMLQAVATEARVAKAREESLLANMESLRREARMLNEREAQALALQNEKDSAEELQATVLKRMKETGLASALNTTNIRVAEAATLPTLPIRPQTRLIVALSAICGLALGIGAAFVTESLDNRVRSPEDIERLLAVPILGVVPAFRAKAQA